MRARAAGVGSIFLVPLLMAGALAVAPLVEQEEPFPHERHQGLFPLCAGCHEGIPEGSREEWYPEPASCAGCHDGVERERVGWIGPSDRVDNVTFDHAEHAEDLEAAGDPAPQCASCHIPAGGERMAVTDEIQVGTCWSCHAHERDEHEDTGAECAQCHVPLAETSFSAPRIRDFATPASHDATDFLLAGHGAVVAEDVGSCVVCHTRDTCVSCHVDPGLPEIAAIPAAPAAMTLPEREAEYPEPPSHMVESWLDGHAADASPGSCSTCHTTDDCRSCHIATVPDAVSALPWRSDSGAPGVGLTGGSPESHSGFFFMQAHSLLAAAETGSCNTCHVDDFCSSCHEAEPGAGYHPQSFMMRHSAEAFSRDTECATCHEEQQFCRACHVEVGIAGQRAVTAGYHDASPVWLLQHGQAARQGLESCASCHKQVDCTRCHSVLGAFKVSPHSPDFDAERAWARSPRTCRACHVGNPLSGGVP